MNSFSLRVTVGIIVILVGFGAVVRIILQRRVKKLLEKINHTLPYAVAAGRLVSDRSGNNNLPGERELWFRGIPADLNDSFQGTIITAAQKQNFVNHYAEFLREVSILARIPRFLRMMPYDFLKFLQDFEAIDELVKQHNSSVINLLMERYRDFFDHCLQYPLDIQQRRAILSEEDNCLVVSSAGSGKTSSIAGKVKYLTEIKGVEPSKILLISYTNKAAHELTERIAIHGLIGYTFHKLAIDLIGRATGAKPLVFDGTDTIFTEVYRRLSAKSFFLAKVAEYFINYSAYGTAEERQQNEQRQQLLEQKSKRLRAMFPDMDGKTIYVRSKQEQQICLILSSLGVQFRYEEPYEHLEADDTHSRYCLIFPYILSMRARLNVFTWNILVLMSAVLFLKGGFKIVVCCTKKLIVNITRA